MLTKIKQFLVNKFGTSTAKDLLKKKDAIIREKELIITELSSAIEVLSTVIDENEALKDAAYALIANQGREIQKLQLELDKLRYNV